MGVTVIWGVGVYNEASMILSLAVAAARGKESALADHRIATNAANRHIAKTIAPTTTFKFSQSLAVRNIFVLGGHQEECQAKDEIDRQQFSPFQPVGFSIFRNQGCN